MSRKPDVIITDDVVAVPGQIRKVMVTGSRDWGVCEYDGSGYCPEHPIREHCPTYRTHRTIMFDAFLEHGLGSSQRNRAPYVALYHGDALGADQMAARAWSAWQRGPIVAYPANWSDLGKRAGHVRNGILVAHMPDLVLAFHLKNSPGTADAIAQAKAAGLKVHVYPKETEK